MKNSLFTEFFEALKRDVFLGFLTSILCISVGVGLSDFYSEKIPESAEYTIESEKVRGVEGGAEYDELTNYKNDIYNRYNTLSGLFLALPLFVVFILITFWELQNRKLELKLKRIEDALGEEGLRKFKESLQYRYHNQSTLRNFNSGYFIGLLFSMVSFVFYYLFQFLLNVILAIIN